MNDLLSRSFSQHRENNAGDIEMGLSPDSEANLERFFQDVAKINDELKDIEELHRKLKAGHEESKTAHNAGVVKALRSRMDTDVNQTLKKAKLIKDRLQVLDRSNAASRKLPDCGPGSSTDRTRTSVVAGLGKKLKDKMEEFQELRGKINEEYRETVERRYYTVTGENPDEKTVDLLISTGESETFLQKAIQQQGRGQILDTIAEIQERHDAVKDIERNLKELHQIFMDIAVLIQHQGEQLDDIEANVDRANSFVQRGTTQLQQARKHQKNTRKWTCFAIILLLIIILIVVLSIRPWK
ncbi:syntaxin-121-like [Amaranthus tricolor]|uniref:syntaxin-121-like n=1 Tax=Amaranthus tricolor TaxID=29722 RepID=UPI002587512D|nr:syntaxin-121-like [Amaranthus tricolor]